MTQDTTEAYRRELIASFQGRTDEDILGPTWTTEQLTQEFTVQAFLAPFVIATHRKTGLKGTLLFRHSPRVYWGWVVDNA